MFSCINFDKMFVLICAAEGIYLKQLKGFDNFLTNQKAIVDWIESPNWILLNSNRVNFSTNDSTDQSKQDFYF